MLAKGVRIYQFPWPGRRAFSRVSESAGHEGDERELRRRTAGYVMFVLAMGFAGNRLVVYIQGLLGGRGITVLELAAALLVVAGWFHAGLVTPRRERPSPTGLVLLGGTLVLLVSQSLAPGYAVMAVVLVTCGVVGLGWGS